MRRAVHTLAAIAVVLTASSAHADARGDAVLARARATERAQLAALAGTTLSMQTRGTLRNGKKTQTIEALRHLGIAADGTIVNEYVWGKIDGVSFDESGLRAASGAPKKRAGQVESLTIAMAPLTGSGIDVTPVGPVDGGYLLRCHVRRDATVARIDLVVDEASGRKLSAALHLAGALVKLADRAEMELAYAPDGTPAELRSAFAARVLWIDRSAEMLTTPLKP
jgi:hypothetical protein